ISLLPKVKKPIHVVLARVPRLEFLTLDYVEVALQTQGSLHLNHHDFTTPKDLQDLYQEVKNYREIPKNKNKKRKN
nr:hypothetical protein [Thermoflexibacter sp.]